MIWISKTEGKRKYNLTEEQITHLMENNHVASRKAGSGYQVCEDDLEQVENPLCSNQRPVAAKKPKTQIEQMQEVIEQQKKEIARLKRTIDIARMPWYVRWLRRLRKQNGKLLPAHVIKEVHTAAEEKRKEKAITRAIKVQANLKMMVM